MAACDDPGDVCPVANVALPLPVASHGDYGAVGLKSYCMRAACGDLLDVSPVVNIALVAVVIVICSFSNHRRKNKAEDERDREQNW
jgi:hypothetical protein